MTTWDCPQDWRLLKAGDVLLGTQYGLNLPSSSEGNMPIAGMKDLNGGLVRDTDLARVQISDHDAQPFLLHEGDLLLNRTNSPDLVGKIGYVGKPLKAVFASYLVRLVPDLTIIDATFLAHWLTSFRGQQEIKPLITRGVSQANINPSTFCSRVRVPVPPLGEQRHIANVLSTWNEALERLASQRARKNEAFGYLREALARGARRLGSRTEHWRKTPLGRLLKPTKRAVPKPTEPYLALSIRSHGKGTFRRLVDRPETVDMDTLYRVGGRDLIVNITFAWEGAIALAKPEDEGCLVSHRFPTFEVDETKVHRDFLGYAVNGKRFFYYLGIASPGGAGRNRVLNQRDFLEIEIPLPPIGEQQAIAEVLNDASREIAALEAEHDALAKQRDALATELLTGRLRVPEAGPAPQAVAS